MLKDEIRKPYFIKLKRFLWEEGVKTVDTSAKSLKIYPARKPSPTDPHCRHVSFNLPIF